MTSQAILFLVSFLLILGAYITLIRSLAGRLNDRISQKMFDTIERILIFGIILGVVGIFQPWAFAAYRYGFLLLLFATLSFIVWSHITPAVPQLDE